MKRPTIPEVLPSLRNYRERYPSGGSLHIVVEDGNVDDISVQFCKRRAMIEGDADGLSLATLLLTMSRTQRKKISALSRPTSPPASPPASPRSA